MSMECELCGVLVRAVVRVKMKTLQRLICTLETETVEVLACEVYITCYCLLIELHVSLLLCVSIYSSLLVANWPISSNLGGWASGNGSALVVCQIKTFC